MIDNAARFAENPFSTRFIKPGGVEHLFAEGSSAAVLIERLAVTQYRGQIVGPHGSGKSSMLRAIESTLESEYFKHISVALHNGQRAMPNGWERNARECNARLIIVDGYEQLSWFNRWRLKRACRKLNSGLLVTAHTDVRLPTIAVTAPSLETAREIVAQLIARNPSPVTNSDVAAAFNTNDGNLREMLLTLYDVHERRIRSTE